VSEYDDYDDWSEYLDPEDWHYAYDDERRVHLSAAEMMTDRAGAADEMRDLVDLHYCADELVDSFGLVEDLARMSLVNSARTCLPAADRAAADTRQALALGYRHRARTAARLVCSSEVWNDRELLAVILRGRCAVLAALRSETDLGRRNLLMLALSILDADQIHLDPVPETSTAAPAPIVSEVTHDPPPRVRCVHHQRRPLVTVSTDDPDSATAVPHGVTLSSFTNTRRLT